METQLINDGSSVELLDLPLDYIKPRWYAAYTSANHEKRVAEQLGVRAVEHFLPTYSSVRRWKDRRVTLELPLFPGYVFVRMALRDHLRVVQVPGVARLVGFGGKPAALPGVRVKDGPLAGLKGILLRWKGNWRVVVSLELIQRSMSVEIGASNLEPTIG